MRPIANAFDGLRLAAALLVLFSHSYPLSGQAAAEPLLRLTGNRATLGEVAVQVFFTISGYLVTLSWLRDPDPRRFLARRALRILPGLALVIFASAALLGPAFSTLPPLDYAARPGTWTYLAKVAVFPAQHGLPGVFEDNPYPGVVNGSLWTLRLEAAFYLLLAATGAAGLLRIRALPALLALGFVCLGLLVAVLGERVPLARQAMIISLNGIPFFAGAAVATFGAGRRGTALALVLAATLSAPLLVFGAGEIAAALLLPLAVLLLGRSFTCDLSRPGDWSYGVYLWAFPVQQAVMSSVPALGPLGLFAVALGPTLLLGALSWTLVERPMLSLKARRAAGRPLSAPAASPGAGRAEGAGRLGFAGSPPIAPRRRS